jgi:hypothetical protein
MMMSTKNSGKRCLLGIAGLLLCVNSHAYSGGNGTEQNPYLISSKADMEMLASEVNSRQSHKGDYFLLTRDLTTPADTITGIIGSSYPFSGIFDGGKHEIAVKINTTAGYVYAGLFGYIDGATIKNLGVSGSVKAIGSSIFAYAGGICGMISETNRTTITNCYNNGSISSEASTFSSSGGICGRIYSDANTTISNCYNNGNISSEAGSASYSGGICGEVDSDANTIISNCYNNGSISSEANSFSSSGGICGDVSSEGSTPISNCYNTGSISSESNSFSRSGGICGDVSSDANTPISNCYNTGYICSDKCAGGIAGEIYDNGIIINCYNIGNVSSSDYAGGIVGSVRKGEIQNCFVANCQIANTGRYAGRIGGDRSSSSFNPYTNNYAEHSVSINGELVSDQDENENNGKDITLPNLQDQAWLASNLFWDFDNVWEIKSGEFPILRRYDAGTASISPVTPLFEVSVYPNPVRQYLYIQCESPVEKVEIYNQTGMMVLRNTNCSEKIDVSALSKGIHVLKVYTGSGVICKKIVVSE